MHASLLLKLGFEQYLRVVQLVKSTRINVIFPLSLSFHKKQKRRKEKKTVIYYLGFCFHINFSNAVIMHSIASPYMHLSRHVTAYYTLIQICREYKWFFLFFVGIPCSTQKQIFDVVWEIDTLQVKIGEKIFPQLFFQRKC